MVKFPEAERRLFHNVFVCRRCKSKIKASNMKVISRKVSCRKCGSNALRAIRRK
ncbi:50S ribosomal protein L40e [Candidatus Woesearchaeota archaeon CG08_land_8_20_14_0_20_47_9]|nr:MAG: 50S ribosomal protein L40e [Candidatus Woesearchaeota archaeon CG08_land_8_20_14_0_20_47_9]HII30007.1 50S ribosomal protein L40e [Candidatus Woesearchaeota archaeon]